jgi:hypothetical protein
MTSTGIGVRVALAVSIALNVVVLGWLSTADTHVQRAYRKIGVSTRAAAALFAMQHGLVASGELPIVRHASHW